MAVKFTLQRVLEIGAEAQRLTGGRIPKPTGEYALGGTCIVRGDRRVQYTDAPRLAAAYYLGVIAWATDDDTSQLTEEIMEAMAELTGRADRQRYSAEFNEGWDDARRAMSDN